MAQRSFKLTDELDARLVAEAARQGRSVSNLILWAVTRELANAERHRRLDLSEKIDELQPSVAVDRLGNREGTPLPKIAPRRPPR